MPGRVFVAIDLERPAVRLVTEASREFVVRAPGWADEKWVAAPLLHVTLLFLGAVPDPAVEALLTTLSEALSPVPSFDLALTRMRAMPSRHRATMLWTTLDDPSGACDALASVVRTAAVGVVPGPPAEDAAGPSTSVRAQERAGASHRFHPHVTVCRARRARRAPQEALNAASAVLVHPGKATDRCVSVRSATLYSSTLGPGGPSYAVLGRIALRSD